MTMIVGKRMHPYFNVNFVANSISQNPSRKKERKIIPLISMFYLYIIPSLQIIFASMKTTKHMRCHDERKT